MTEVNMDANILVQLLAQRINGNNFWLSGLEVIWLDVNGLPDKNSIYNTPENCAIIADVVANYDTLAAAYEVSQVTVRKRLAYKAEADPLYAEWQALLTANHEDAEARRVEWLAKRAEIKARFGAE
jgi:hypothetical protein